MGVLSQFPCNLQGVNSCFGFVLATFLLFEAVVFSESGFMDSGFFSGFTVPAAILTTALWSLLQCILLLTKARAAALVGC